MNDITKFLVSQKDEKYKNFTAGLIPNISRDLIIGVRIPVIRKYAKELYKAGAYSDFLKALPHICHEENLLHIFLISLFKDYDEAVKQTKIFLPYIDNWAVCDSFNPKCFGRNKDKLIEEIRLWIKDERIYTKRFAVDMLMSYYLDDDFDEEYLALVSEISGDDYYLKMVIAWFFATALAKQYENAVVFLQEKKLEKWVHNKTIQKACESYRISPEKKTYLRTLRIK